MTEIDVVNETMSRTYSVNSTNENTLRYISCTAYLVTFAFGFLGNTLTIVAILSERKLKSTATCFILNLAIADDLFIFSLPFHAHSTYTSHWIFGSVACKLLSVLKGVNGYASIFTMVLMSVDRYWAVVHPLKSIKYRTVRNATVVCVLLWVICAIIMTPNWLYADVISCGRSRKCEITWPHESARAHLLFWANFELVIGFLLPVVVVGVCYTLLLVGLAQHRQSTSNASCRSSPERSRSLQRSRSSRASTATNASSRPMRKVTAMVFMVTIAFVVCWTPYYVVSYNSTLIAASNSGNLTTTVNNTQSCSDGPRRRRDTVELSPKMFAYIVLNVVAQGLVFISSCCNPFIYCISSRKFPMTS